MDGVIDQVRKLSPAAADALIKDPKLQLGIADYKNQFGHTGSDFIGFLAGNPKTLGHVNLQAGTPPTREDVQMFIESTAYGRDKANAKGIKSREERLEGALYELGLSDSPQVSHAGATLKEHSHGAAVLKLQGQLAEFGYTDAKGRPLQTDGDFGPGTEAAVKAFQLDHGLTPDGKVGTKTQSAMQGDLQSLKNDDPGLLPAVSAMSSRPAATPGLDDPRDVLNPNHALYNTLKERIPDASDRRLLQFTAACHSGQISAENLGGVHFDRTEGRMTFLASWPPGPPASVDLKTLSPNHTSPFSRSINTTSSRRKFRPRSMPKSRRPMFRGSRGRVRVTRDISVQVKR